MGYDACAVMTVPVNKYRENPQNPDLGAFYKENWVPCPLKCSEKDDRMNNAAYKLCIQHDTYKSYEQGCSMGCDKATCEFVPGCVHRVDGIEACRNNVADAQRANGRLLKLLSCAGDQTMNILTVITSLELLGIQHDNFPFWHKNYSLVMSSMRSRSERAVFYQM